MKVKICGITNLNDAEQCVNLGADALGFIFYRSSKRYIEPDAAELIISKLPPLVFKVGVFVNEEVDIVNKTSALAKVNIVQLHGEESPDYIKKINLPVIKAFRIDESFEFDKLLDYSNCSFLLDSYNPNEYGGTGEAFNWDRIPIILRNKIILAGGISQFNIENVYNNISPYAVDISSSVESEPGIKDVDKLKALFKTIGELKK